MSSQGPNTADVMNSVVPGGLPDPTYGNAWSGTGNIAASDNSYAEAALHAEDGGFGSTVTAPQLFYVQDFDFALTSGATITGFKAEIEARYVHNSGTNIAPHLIVGLLDALDGEFSDQTGTPKESNDLTTSDATYTLGGDGDLWDAPLTESLVENVNFGIWIHANWGFVSPSEADQTIRIDRVQATVYYTLGGAKFSATFIM